TITATDATGLTGQGTITVNGGSGDGSFQNTDGSNSLSAATQPERIEAGDFDGDGFVDIAVVTNNGTLHIFKSNGNGTFQASLTSTVDSNGREFAVADLNVDGKLDVVVGVANVNEMSVFLGNGDLTFQAKVDYAGETGWEGTTVGDFDNDGILDVVGTSDPNDNISFYKGNGDGTFQTYSTTGSINRPFHAESADLNLDGNLDLVVPNYAGAPSTNSGASVFLGKGDGTFQSPVEYATNTNSRSVAIADLNNDGKLDLATANNGAASISVLLGNGDGTFQTAIDTAVGNNPYDLAACDMNSDGVMDLVVGSEGSARVDVLFGNNNGTFAVQTPFTGAGGPKDMICRDFNNDGIMDVATPTVNNHVLRVYMGN
ncbi:MAG: VCBS repeat-containing protein, partial [Leptospiraceae bacterium]|nr:VCBS repeat-containing protein [Leptospiraceae bacterium]